MEPVRIGLVGYGFGGRWFHATMLAAAPECAFLGGVTTSEERRALVAAEHPGTSSFGSPEELAAAGAEAACTVRGPMDGQEAALLAGRTPATERGRWDTSYPAFARPVRGEGAVPVDPRDAVRTATVLDAARRSATEGTVVPL